MKDGQTIQFCIEQNSKAGKLNIKIETAQSFSNKCISKGTSQSKIKLWDLYLKQQRTFSKENFKQHGEKTTKTKGNLRVSGEKLEH